MRCWKLAPGQKAPSSPLYLENARLPSYSTEGRTNHGIPNACTLTPQSIFIRGRHTCPLAPVRTLIPDHKEMPVILYIQLAVGPDRQRRIRGSQRQL